MAYHFIAIASGYFQGSRIAWHYASEEKLDKERIKAFMEEAAKQNGVQFGIHKLSTESCDWESVVEKDSFFADIYATEDEELFLEMLCEDKEITALDIAKFIITLRPVSHLKLQKLVYLVYAKYLVNHDRPLFKEEIVAYQYGPVIEEVYQTFKVYGAEEITDPVERYTFKIRDTEVPPLLMKIMSSDDGLKVILTILDVFKKYGDYTASQLVKLTHAPGSPWSKAYKGRYSSAVITDEFIKKYHVNEA